MKHYFSSSVIILLFVLFLGFPQQVFAGASTGLTLWFQVIFPTLLPFIILSNLMIHTSAIHILAKALSPVLSRLFGVSDYGTFAILTGFLCGYPMGSKVTADLVKEGFISRKEGQYLLGFCNNTSPMFIISYLMWQSLKLQKHTIPSLIILFLSPVIVSILLRRFQGDLQTKYKNMSAPLISKSLTDVLDFCIMNGFETIAKIGGYMMLFSIFFTLIDTFVQVRSLPMTLFTASLELTNGVSILCQNMASAPLYIAALSLTSFGGWCAVAQTYSMIQDSGLKIWPYVIEKLATAAVTSLCASIYIMFL